MTSTLSREHIALRKLWWVGLLAIVSAILEVFAYLQGTSKWGDGLQERTTQRRKPCHKVVSRNAPSLSSFLLGEFLTSRSSSDVS
jgi:hypothetical protein